MNLVRYGKICLVCALVFIISGCAENRVSVVNTSSGIIIHSDDYLNKLEVNKPKQEQPKTTGNVIHLGNSYEKIDLPMFDRL